MKKRRAKLNFYGIIFVCFILFVLAVVRFPVGGYQEYVGFLRAIELGMDYKGGITLVLEAQSNSADKSNFSSGVEAHAKRIDYILENNSYDANVYTVNGTNVVLEVFNEYATDAILDLISTNNNKLYFRGEKSTTAEAYLTEKDITDAYAMENSYYGYSTSASKYGIYISFTDTGKKQMASLTSGASSSSSKTIYIYIGDTLFQQISVTEEIDQDYIFISGGSNLNTLDGANQYAGRILSTKYDYTFEQKSSTAISQSDAKRNLILSCVLAILVVIASLIVLCVKFNKLGLVNFLTLFCGLLLQIIFLQAVPGIVLTAPAFMGSILVYVIGFVCVYYMLSKIANEYAQGKKIHSSIKFGFIKNYLPLVEFSTSYLAANIIFYIFGSVQVKYFAFASIVGIIIYALTSIAFARLLDKLCYDICKENASSYNFKREAGVHELEEI